MYVNDAYMLGAKQAFSFGFNQGKIKFLLNYL